MNERREREESRVSLVGTMSPGESSSTVLTELLQESLRRVVAERQHLQPDNARLRMLLRGPCDRARRDGIHVERLLVVLKRCWRELPEVMPVPHREASDTLARLATACIDEYFGDRGASEGSSQQNHDGDGHGGWSRRQEMR
jgi:hypothetical protein